MGRTISRVSPKGQVTIPAEIRQLLGLKPKDKVAFEVEHGVVKIIRAHSRLDEIFMSVPALDPPRTWEEVTEIAREEHVREIHDKMAD